MPNSYADVQAFLGLHRIAMAGVSREPAAFSRSIYREFVRRGYDVIPVNPSADEIEGRPCYHSVSEIQPPVEGALITTSGAAVEAVVKECEAAGVKHVWLSRGVNSPQAVTFGQERGMNMVVGECPLMFLERAGFVHSVHGFFRKMSGTYPH